jgi:hypothetical protein
MSATAPLKEVENVQGALIPNVCGRWAATAGRYEGVTSRKRPRERGSSIAQPVVDRGWGYRGLFMNESSRSKRIKNVVRLRVARERAHPPRDGSDRHVTKRSNQKLLERLEAENEQLRASVVELILEIRALRDGAK